MRIGLGLGWQGEPFGKLLGVVQEAERLGIDSVWSLEEDGPDAVTVLGYLAACTERIKLGTGIAQIPARTPAMTAMTALSLDVLSEGRFQLGLGLSIPRLVEGWHGVPYTKPLTRTREYVNILRTAMTGGKVEHVGEHYEIPYRGPDSNEAKPMRAPLTPSTHIPIYLAAVGPRSVALTGEIADGWLPSLYSPEHDTTLTTPLDTGLRKAGRDPRDVTIAPIVQVARRDTLDEARDSLRPVFAAFLGPVGLPRTGNPYFDVACQMGYEAAARTVREHYMARQYANAIAAVPDAFIDEVALVGPLEAIVDRIAAWRESRVSTLIPVTEDIQLLEAVMDAAR